MNFLFIALFSITRIKHSIAFTEYVAKNLLFRCFPIHVSRKIVQYPFRIDLPNKDARFSLKVKKKNILDSCLENTWIKFQVLK